MATTAGTIVGARPRSTATLQQLAEENDALSEQLEETREQVMNLDNEVGRQRKIIEDLQAAHKLDKCRKVISVINVVALAGSTLARYLWRVSVDERFNTRDNALFGIQLAVSLTNESIGFSLLCGVLRSLARSCPVVVYGLFLAGSLALFLLRLSFWG